MPGAPIEFYFDFSSPYGYLASERIDAIGAEFGREVAWHPVLLGVIFKTTGMSPLVSQALRGPYHKRDMERSARKHGTKFALPDSFPFNSVYQCRIYYWLLQSDVAQAKAYAHAVFRAAFTQNRTVPEAEDAIALAVELGHDAAAVTAGMQDPAVKDRLRQETQDAMHKGVFGSPFIIIDGEPFWGNDRLGEVREWLQTGGW
jgi:2-hydroxychromene-2-carboxylate isomerase